MKRTGHSGDVNGRSGGRSTSSALAAFPPLSRFREGHKCKKRNIHGASKEGREAEAWEELLA